MARICFFLSVGCTLAALTLFASTVRAQSHADALRVMTFNIRYNTPSDSADAWPHRKDMAASMIRLHGADVVGLQEALKGQIEDLQDRLPDFAWFGVGRADGKEAGEFSPIFYREDRLDLLDHDTFWLSTTPSEPGSKSWDAAIERIATWGIFRDRATGEEVFVLNTHFDHVGEEARLESARLIVDRLAALAGDRPVVVMGDFNATPGSAPYEAMTAGMLRDAMHASEHPHHGPTSTWTGFREIVPDRRIDYVFVNDGFRVVQHAILSDQWDGRFPSDHLPVLAELVVR